jgi:hypothetical protein
VLGPGKSGYRTCGITDRHLSGYRVYQALANVGKPPLPAVRKAAQESPSCLTHFHSGSTLSCMRTLLLRMLLLFLLAAALTSALLPHR